MFMPSIKPQVYQQFNPQLLFTCVDLAENQQMNEIGRKIKAAIEAKGITQMALAEAVGVSNNAVTKWVRTGKVAKNNIQKVAKELGMSATDFLGGQQDDDDLEIALRLLKNKKLRALLFAAEPLPEYKIDALVQTSIALAEPAEHKQNGTQ